MYAQKLLCHFTSKLISQRNRSSFFFIATVNLLFDYIMSHRKAVWEAHKVSTMIPFDCIYDTFVYDVSFVLWRTVRGFSLRLREEKR